LSYDEIFKEVPRLLDSHIVDTLQVMLEINSPQRAPFGENWSLI